MSSGRPGSAPGERRDLDLRVPGTTGVGIAGRTSELVRRCRVLGGRVPLGPTNRLPSIRLGRIEVRRRASASGRKRNRHD